MPLDLPPPLPPQQADVAILEERHAVSRTQGNVIEIQVGQYTLKISGNTYLEEDRIREVVSVGKTPSQVILLLNALYAAEGYLLVNVEYGREGNSDLIYVQVNEGYLEEVDAPPALAPYFEKFEGREGLRKQDVEPMRVLAQMKADRAGYDVSSQYSVSETDPAAFTLTMDGEADPEHDPAQFTAVFGNPGNRFLGRYFGFTNAKFNTPGGDQIGLGYGTAFTGLGDNRGGQDFDRYDFSYSTVTTVGLYNLSASYTEYQVNDRFGPESGVDSSTEEAETTQVSLGGNQFLYADEKTRWVLEEQLQYVESIIEFVASDPEGLVGQRAQDERYGAARLGTTVSHSWKLFGRRGSLNAGAGYKRGFGGHIDNLVNPDRHKDFDLFDAQFGLRYQLPWSMLASLHVEGQQSIDHLVPEQEQWVLGGPDRLAAYLPGVMVGDSGAYGRLQLQLPRWHILGRPLRFSVFTEAGTAQFEAGPNDATRLAYDAGVKLEVAPTEWLELTAYTAEGFGERNLEDGQEADFVEDSETDFFFNVKAQF